MVFSFNQIALDLQPMEICHLKTTGSITQSKTVFFNQGTSHAQRGKKKFLTFVPV